MYASFLIPFQLAKLKTCAKWIHHLLCLLNWTTYSCSFALRSLRSILCKSQFLLPPSNSPWSQEERVRTGLVLDWLSLIGPTLFQASNRNGADWAQEDVPLVGLFSYFPWYTVWCLYWVKSNSSTFSQVSNVSVGVCLRPPDPIMFTWSPPRLLWSVGNLEKVASRPPKLPVQCVPSSKCYQKLLTLTLSSLLQYELHCLLIDSCLRRNYEHCFMTRNGFFG